MCFFSLFQNDFKKLLDLSKKHGFLLFEDRKFSDIGNTVKMQYSQGVHSISDWAHLVTVHGISGQGVLDGLKSGLVADGNHSDLRGALMLAEMSSEGKK